MKKIFILSIGLLFMGHFSKAQNYDAPTPELHISYFGEFAFHPGAKVGLSLPFSQWSKERMQETKRRGEYAIIKQKELRLGGNLAFYHIVKNHNGYLINTELTFRRSKFYSFRPEKRSQLEFAFGLGYFRYHLHGTTFEPNGDSFKEINGNGGAFMPSFSIGYGGTFKWKGEGVGRYFLKPSAYFEVPFGTGLQMTTVLEAGITVPLNIKGFEVEQGKRKIVDRRKKKK